MPRRAFGALVAATVLVAWSQASPCGSELPDPEDDACEVATTESRVDAMVSTHGWMLGADEVRRLSERGSNGDPEAAHRVALHWAAIDDGRDDRGRNWFELAAENGSSDGMIGFGAALTEMGGVDRCARADFWFAAASSSARDPISDAEAREWIRTFGCTGPKTLGAAEPGGPGRDGLRASALAGDASAAFALATSSTGREKEKWERIAAQNGHRVAAARVARALAQTGDRLDCIRALHWERRAASRSAGLCDTSAGEGADRSSPMRSLTERPHHD